MGNLGLGAYASMYEIPCQSETGGGEGRNFFASYLHTLASKLSNDTLYDGIPAYDRALHAVRDLNQIRCEKQGYMYFGAMLAVEVRPLRAFGPLPSHPPPIGAHPAHLLTVHEVLAYRRQSLCLHVYLHGGAVGRVAFDPGLSIRHGRLSVQRQLGAPHYHRLFRVAFGHRVGSVPHPFNRPSVEKEYRRHQPGPGNGAPGFCQPRSSQQRMLDNGVG